MTQADLNAATENCSTDEATRSRGRNRWNTTCTWYTLCAKILISAVTLFILLYSTNIALPSFLYPYVVCGRLSHFGFRPGHAHFLLLSHAFLVADIWHFFLIVPGILIQGFHTHTRFPFEMCCWPEIPGVSQVENGGVRRSYTSYIYETTVCEDPLCCTYRCYCCCCTAVDCAQTLLEIQRNRGTYGECKENYWVKQGGAVIICTFRSKSVHLRHFVFVDEFRHRQQQISSIKRKVSSVQPGEYSQRCFWIHVAARNATVKC